jgi:hypothetical protein
MMFSEAAHHDEYYLQPLSKGSSRLAYEAQVNSEEPIYIVPVGINYGHLRNPFCDLHLVFGKAILIQPLIGTSVDKPERINTIKSLLRTEMEKCMWLPKKDEYYEDRKKLIHGENTKKSFHELKKGIQDKSLRPKKALKKQKWLVLLIGLLSIPNFPPLIVIKKILGLFKDVVFYSSVKMSTGLILFIFWWAGIFILVGILWGWKIGLSVTIGCVALLYIRQILSIKYL